MGDVINYREMATIVRDRVQDMVKKDMTLEQVKAAKPTRDYDPLYNTPGAFMTARRVRRSGLQEPEKVTRMLKVLRVLAVLGFSWVPVSAQFARKRRQRSRRRERRARGAGRRRRRRRTRRRSI